MGAIAALPDELAGCLDVPARMTPAAATPWVPLAQGRAFKPIRFLRDDRGYVALLRLDPGTVVPPHRHTGELHAYTLSGCRELASGERVGPGDYVYEPAGCIDAWTAVGDEPVIVLIVLHGAVEFLDAGGAVAWRYSAQIKEKAYREHCAAHGLEPLDLVE